MADVSFSATVEGWVAEQHDLAEEVFRQSANDMLFFAQAKIPVLTGWARASVRVAYDAFPLIDPNSFPAPDAPERSYPYDSEKARKMVMNAKLGQVLYIAWTAAYVDFLEYGSSRKAPSGFVRIAAQRWPERVAFNVENVKVEELV